MKFRVPAVIMAATLATLGWLNVAQAQEFKTGPAMAAAKACGGTCPDAERLAKNARTECGALNGEDPGAAKACKGSIPKPSAAPPPPPPPDRVDTDKPEPRDTGKPTKTGKRGPKAPPVAKSTATDPCGALTDTRVCEGDKLRWCVYGKKPADNTIGELDCGAQGQGCGFDGVEGNNCVVRPVAIPSSLSEEQVVELVRKNAHGGIPSWFWLVIAGLVIAIVLVAKQNADLKRKLEMIERKLTAMELRPAYDKALREREAAYRKMTDTKTAYESAQASLAKVAEALDDEDDASARRQLKSDKKGWEAEADRLEKELEAASEAFKAAHNEAKELADKLGKPLPNPGQGRKTQAPPTP